MLEVTLSIRFRSFIGQHYLLIPSWAQHNYDREPRVADPDEL